MPGIAPARMHLICLSNQVLGDLADNNDSFDKYRITHNEWEALNSLKDLLAVCDLFFFSC